ncbi:MAG: hypothetical protein GXX79_20405 [Actinomycetales bacterium]|nr:hypothetical protein [Actinomycetales bacterium]
MTVLDSGLLTDATTVVKDSFDGKESFSCLTGGIVSGTATGTSDIDLVVVLPAHIPLAEAMRFREAFTRHYVDLHRRHHRTPDLDWPGEVLYTTDLAAALDGAVFLDHRPETPLSLCPPDQPYRYWISMIATGVALTHPAAFEDAAIRCAAAIANHLLTQLVTGSTFRTSVPGHATASRRSVIDGLLQRDWGLASSPPHPSRLAVVHRQVHAAVVRLAHQGSGHLTQWRGQLCPATTVPALEQCAANWRRIARKAIAERAHAPEHYASTSPR